MILPEIIYTNDSSDIISMKQAINNFILFGKPVSPEIKEIIDKVYPYRFNYHELGSWTNYIYR